MRGVACVNLNSFAYVDFIFIFFFFFDKEAVWKYNQAETPIRPINICAVCRTPHTTQTNKRYFIRIPRRCLQNIKFVFDLVTMYGENRITTTANDYNIMTKPGMLSYFQRVRRRLTRRKKETSFLLNLNWLSMNWSTILYVYSSLCVYEWTDPASWFDRLAPLNCSILLGGKYCSALLTFISLIKSQMSTSIQ